MGRGRLRAERLAGCKVRRQYPVERSIADFARPTARPIVGLDGSRHADSGYGRQRDGWLAVEGWRVPWNWNKDLFDNEEGVLTAIFTAVAGSPPNPSPARGEGISGADNG